jgi:hypothetical protein
MESKENSPPLKKLNSLSSRSLHTSFK